MPFLFGIPLKIKSKHINTHLGGIMKAVLILVLFVGMTSCKNKQDSPVPLIEKEDSLFKNINRDSLFFNRVFFH